MKPVKLLKYNTIIKDLQSQPPSFHQKFPNLFSSQKLHENVLKRIQILIVWNYCLKGPINNNFKICIIIQEFVYVSPVILIKKCLLFSTE